MTTRLDTRRHHLNQFCILPPDFDHSNDHKKTCKLMASILQSHKMSSFKNLWPFFSFFLLSLASTSEHMEMFYPNSPASTDPPREPSQPPGFGNQLQQVVYWASSLLASLKSSLTHHRGLTTINTTSLTSAIPRSPSTVRHVLTSACIQRPATQHNLTLLPVHSNPPRLPLQLRSRCPNVRILGPLQQQRHLLGRLPAALHRHPELPSATRHHPAIARRRPRQLLCHESQLCRHARARSLGLLRSSERLRECDAAVWRRRGGWV